MATVDLALKVTGAIGSSASVTLSTANITEAPLLYAVNTSSYYTIQGATFSGLRFNRTYLPYGLNKTVTFSFNYVDGVVVPITITLEGLTLDGSDARMTSNGDGTYTFTPPSTNTTAYTLNLKSTTLVSSGTVTLSNENYETAQSTINRHWVTGSYTIDFTNSSYFNTNSFTDATSGITVNLTNCEGKRDWGIFSYSNYRKDIGSSNGNGVISISSESSSYSGCKLTGATFTYYSNYNQQNVSSNVGTISNNKQTWTASSSGTGNGDTSVNITMRRNGNNVNTLTKLVVNYGYYE